MGALKSVPKIFPEEKIFSKKLNPHLIIAKFQKSCLLIPRGV
jgi:hypothetical protein